MTSAVFLSRFLETKNIEKALELCTAAVFGVLEKSLKYAASQEKKSLLELKFISAQQEFVSPSHSFKAERIKNETTD
jgi:pyridoxine kinase